MDRQHLRPPPIICLYRRRHHQISMLSTSLPRQSQVLGFGARPATSRRCRPLPVMSRRKRSHNHRLRLNMRSAIPLVRSRLSPLAHLSQNSVRLHLHPIQQNSLHLSLCLPLPLILAHPINALILVLPHLLSGGSPSAVPPQSHLPLPPTQEVRQGRRLQAKPLQQWR